MLILALRSLVAAGLPLFVGIAGLGAGTAITALLAGGDHISTEAPTVASMVGLGVGIDYALLLVSRHVEGLRAGLRRPWRRSGPPPRPGPLCLSRA